MSVLTVKSWTGGLTDFYLGEDPTSFQFADNLDVDNYGKLVSRPGTVIDFDSAIARAQMGASVGTRRIGLLIPQKLGSSNDFVLVKQVGEKLWYDNGTSSAELVGPSSASAFSLSSPITGETAFSYAEWNNHSFIAHESPYQKPVMMYNDSSGILRLRSAGLPKLASGFTATGGSGANYIYALVYKYSYSVSTIDYSIRAAPQYTSFTNIGTATASASPGITVGSIPVLANANGDHYDTTTIVVEVYRTTNNGTVFYYVGELTNGTTSFSDTVSDDTLVANDVTLYTVDGSADNDRPPKCKYVHGTSDFVYYANGYEVGTESEDLELQPQRLYQAKRGAPSAVPATFFADMEEPITGVSSVKSIPIVFCENSIYRIDGFYDDLGRGGMVPKKISDRVGGVGHLSLVQTLDGVFFAGNDAFYFTDGYTVTRLTPRIRTTYQALVDTELKRKRLAGAYDVVKNNVLWCTHNERETDADNGKMFVADLDSKSLTTYSSGYDGDPATYTDTVSTSGTTVTMTDTTTVDVGSRFIITDAASSASIKAYVVSVDSATQVTISHSAGSLTGATVEVVEQSNTSELFANFRPTSIVFANKKIYFGNMWGFTVYFDHEATTDPWFNPASATPSSDITTVPIYFNHDSVAHDFGASEVRKWVNYIIVKARPVGDVSSNIAIQVGFENDDDGYEYSLEPITLQGFPRWGSLTYGDPVLWQRVRTIIDSKRRFPANTLRCAYRQISLSMGFVLVYQSGTQSTVAVSAGPDAVSKTITVTGDSLNDDIENLYLSLEGDEYEAEYKIVEQTSPTVFTVLDTADALAIQSGKKWVMRGFPKNALINLLEYTINYELIGPSQLPYQGENAISQ